MISIDGATPITLTLTLSALQWNVVMAALAKAPLSYEVAAPLIQLLSEHLQQAVPQANGSAATAQEDVHVPN